MSTDKTTKTVAEWLKEPQYNHIETADFSRGKEFFVGDPETERMEEATFKARLGMAKVRYKTKSYKKKPLEAQAHQTKTDTIVMTPQGRMVVKQGDYIVYDEQGEPHPMPKDAFESIYDEVK